MRGVVGVIIGVAIISAGWYGYRHLFAPSAEPKYTTVEVRRGSIVQTVSATGTVEPLVTVLVGSQVSGTITRWYADFNQQVQEGFVLAELDQDRFRAQLEQRTAAVAVANARVEEAQARLALASLDRERIEQAYERSAASEYEVRAARAEEAAALAALHAAQAQLQAAQADQRMAAIELEKTIIRSPIDGVVISRNVDAGQTVAASLAAPTLFTIANDLRRMRVNAAVSETDIGMVREGMPAEFRVDAYPGRRFQGTVSQVRYAQTVVDNVVTYTTLIEVDNPELLLRPGMTATILFEVARAENVLLVPNAALRFDPRPAAAAGDRGKPGRGRPAAPRVFRLEGNQLVEVPIEPGLTDGSFTEVRGGALREGDRVVIDMQPPPGSTRTGPPRMPRL